MNFHPSIHLNQSYQPYSSTNSKSFGSNLDVQHKKYKNPLKNEDHYVPSKRHVNAKMENVQKRPQRSTIKRAKLKKIWVPKSIIKEMCSQASKEQEKYKAIWIPKSHLKDLNIENTSKLTFKLPKASTPSSSKIISKTISKPSTSSSSKISLLPHTSIPQAISSIIPTPFKVRVNVDLAHFFTYPHEIL